MTFSERFLAGFALAATIARDPGAQQAQAGLAQVIAPQLTALPRELAALPKAERRARVRAWLGAPQPLPARTPPIDTRAPTPALRAYALLAHRQRTTTPPPDWLRNAPLPRAGYTPPPELLAQLAQITLRLQTRERDDQPAHALGAPR
ncbi:MAG: hypothetical protein ABW321_12320 [Polyangiales bacterium]